MRKICYFWLLVVFLCACNTIDPDIPGGYTSFQDQLPACSVEVIDRAGTYVKLKVRIDHQSNTSLDKLQFCYNNLNVLPDTTGMVRNLSVSVTNDNEAEIILTELKPATSYHYTVYMANMYRDGYAGIASFTTLNARWEKVMDMPAHVYGSHVVNVGDRVFLITDNQSSTDGDSEHPFPEYNQLWEFNPDIKKWVYATRTPFLSRSEFAYWGIGNKIYIGTGYGPIEGSVYLTKYTDLWCYDLNLNEWEQKRNFYGFEKIFMSFFSIGDKGYLMSSSDFYNMDNQTQMMDDMHLYEYDMYKDIWMEKTSFPGTKADAASMVVKDRLFVLTGIKSNYEYDGNNVNYLSGEYISDMWEYESENDKWIKKSYFAGGGRYKLMGGFSIGGKGFVGGGIGGVHPQGRWMNDWWGYLPETDTWIAYPKLPFSPNYAFELKGDSYVGRNYVGIYKYIEW